MNQVASRAFGADSVELAFESFVVPQGDVEVGLASALSDCAGRAPLSGVVRQTLFLAPDTDRAAVERALRATYGERGPATTIVYQPPADGEALAAELWGFSRGAEVRQTGPLAVATAGKAQWGFIGGFDVAQDEGPYGGVTRALQEANATVEREGFRFGDVVRTWYYIGRLLDDADAGSRYDRFNQARNEFFARIWKDLRYSPASTGIGMDTRRIAFEAMLLRGAPGSFEVTWVDNPLQTRPYVYDIAVDHQQKPSFSRAAAVTLPDWMMVLVSGTASIRKSEVVCVDDVAAQTQMTIDNVATLIGPENLTGNYRLPAGAALRDLQQFRVYVKRRQDVEAVRAVCGERLPDVPCLYLVADVCRAQCLVEIEGVAAVRL